MSIRRYNVESDNFQKYTGQPKNVSSSSEKTKWQKFLEWFNPYLKHKREQGEILLEAKLMQEIGKANQELGKGKQEQLKAKEMEIRLYKTIDRAGIIENENAQHVIIDEEKAKSRLDNLIESKTDYLRVVKNISIEYDTETNLDNHVKEAFHSKMNLPIEDLNLTVRTYNIFKKAEINKIGELTKYTERELLDIIKANISQKDIEASMVKKVLAEIVTEVYNNGLRFGLSSEF